MYIIGNCLWLMFYVQTSKLGNSYERNDHLIENGIKDVTKTVQNTLKTVHQGYLGESGTGYLSKPKSVSTAQI